jgi:hypothetical protein
MYKQPDKENTSKWAALLSLPKPTEIDPEMEGFTPVESEYSFDGEAFGNNLKKVKEQIKPTGGTEGVGAGDSGEAGETAKKALSSAGKAVGKAASSAGKAVGKAASAGADVAGQFFSKLGSLVGGFFG